MAHSLLNYKQKPDVLISSSKKTSQTFKIGIKNQIEMQIRVKKIEEFIEKSINLCFRIQRHMKR